MINMTQEEYIKLLQQPLITELNGVNKNIDAKFISLNEKMDGTELRNKKQLEDHEKDIKIISDKLSKNDFRTNLLWGASGLLGSGLIALFFWMFKIFITMRGLE